MAGYEGEVTGLQQSPSTPFDPAPQLAIHAIQGVDDGRVVMTGRCWFEPVHVGSVFTRIASEGADGWTVLGDCHLELESIGLHYLYVDRLEQTHSGRMWLVGVSQLLTDAAAADAGAGLLLVGDEPPAAEWAWDGAVWSRRPLDEDEAPQTPGPDPGRVPG